MSGQLHFTGNEEADQLIFEDPFALLIGFALDQRVPVPKAFMGPFVLRERLGSLDPRVVAEADLEPIFRQIPAIHRFPAMMAKQTHALAAHVVEVYDCDAGNRRTQAAAGRASRHGTRAADVPARTASGIRDEASA